MTASSPRAYTAGGPRRQPDEIPTGDTTVVSPTSISHLPTLNIMTPMMRKSIRSQPGPYTSIWVSTVHTEREAAGAENANGELYLHPS